MRPRRSIGVLVAWTVVSTMLVTVLGGSSGAGGGSSCFDNNPTKHGKMKGDIDGNGTRDLVWVAANRPNGRCHYFAKVDLGANEARKRLYGDRIIFRYYSKVTLIIEVDTVPGKEFGVVMQQGASTTFVGLFTIRTGEVERIKVNGPGAPYDDLFGNGASIAVQTASDCARHRPAGQVINSTSVLNEAGTHYRVERRWFESTGVNLRRTAEPTDKRRIPYRDEERPREFQETAFGSCPGRDTYPSKPRG